MIHRPNLRISSILALALSLPALACQDGADGVQTRLGGLDGAPGLKVSITGAGDFDHTRAQAIAALIESKGQDVGAATVKLEQGDGPGTTLDIEMWGTGLPKSQDLAGLLAASFPELATANIQVAELAPGTGPRPIAFEVSDDLSAADAKAEIVEQLAGEGVVDVKVEDGEHGRRIEVRVEKTHVE